MRNIFQFFLIDDSDNEEEIQRRPRQFRHRINTDINENTAFREAFRVDMDVANYILIMIGPTIKYSTSRNYAVTPREQLLITLHWLGNGSQYHIMGSCHGIAEPTVCRIVHRVSSAICSQLLGMFVRWPNDPTNISNQFYNLGGFRGIFNFKKHT